ncbi:hypothetical protein CCAE64S_01516 [Castellaniella caeni]
MDYIVLLGMAALSFSLVLMVACCLVPCGMRRTTILVVFLGFVFSCLKIWAFQHAPQWQEIIPDSSYYDSNARAFASHWSGAAVDGGAYQLRGLLAAHAAGVHGREWLPDDMLTYNMITGSHEWLYAGYIALWYWLGEATPLTVIWTNALWAAFLPAAAFGIAYSLGAGKRLALVSAGLTLLDPSLGANASWLLKDTLASFLCMAALWGFLAYIRLGGIARCAIAAMMLSMLGGVRFVAFVGLIISTALICVWLIFQKRDWSMGFSIMGAILCAWLMQGFLAQAPHVFLDGGKGVGIVHFLIRPLEVFAGGVEVLGATSGGAVDESVLTWTTSMADQPVHSILRSVAHTLFAPYPWIAFSAGLTWKTPTELYYPGVFLWILSLPGIIVAVFQGLRKVEPSYWLLLLFLASQLAAYTIWLGEWSTRQRIFVLPAFFVLTAIGYASIRSWHSNFHNVRSRYR